MVERSLLSVVVPVYNVEHYLRRCLDSICNQSYRELEIICVNDGSTDQSLDILREYAERDSRIQVISKENGGLVSARKAGIICASGEYVTYVDSDDWIEQGMYEELMGLAMSENADIVTSGDIRDYGTHVVEEPEFTVSAAYTENKLKQLKENLIDTEFFFRKNLSIHVYDKIFRREYLLKYQLRINNQISVGEDAAVVYPAMLNAHKIVVSGRNYYHYCLRNDSIMGKRKKNDMDSINILLNQLREDFSEVEQNVKNVSKQYRFLSLYFNLLRNAKETIKYKNGFLYPFGYIPLNSDVVIYGAGKFGNELKAYLEEKNFFHVGTVLDKSLNFDSVLPSEIKKIQFDYVIIAVLVYDVIEEIREELRYYGVQDKQILYVNAEVI